MTDLRLWCIVEGESNGFRVSISPGLYIADLKTKIHEQIKPVACGPSRFNLTKVDIKFDDDQVKTGLHRPSHGDQVLEDHLLISDVWPEAPPSNRLNVFVDLPADPSSPNLNAGELHSRIWNRADLISSLFRTVQVTRAHYDALQARLNQKYPDRGLDQYVGRNVLSDKLDILRSTIPTEPFPSRRVDHVDNGDDPEAIDSLFPSTLKFLDLSPLKLEHRSDHFPSPLFLREEYDHISNLTKSYPQGGPGSVIISGQPGTGKTSYLYVKIIQHLIKARPFLYQTTHGHVFRVSQDGVEAIGPSWLPKTHIMAFVDADDGKSEPNDILKHPYVQVIIASSPNGANQRWIKQAGPYTAVTKLATSLWSPRELLLTGIFLHPYDVTFELLRKATSYFGYNPRLCFYTSRSVTSLREKREEVRRQITQIARKGNVLNELELLRLGTSELSHTIFQLSIS